MADILSTFEELLMHVFLVDRYGMLWKIPNYAFGATTGHPFIGAIIENCVKAQRDRAWPDAMWRPIPRLFREAFYVLDTTGPGLVSRTLAEYPDAASQVKVLFPVDVCDMSQWHQFGDYGVHLQEGGWRSRKSLIWRKLAAFWESRARAKFLEDSKRRGPNRDLLFSRRQS